MATTVPVVYSKNGKEINNTFHSLVLTNVYVIPPKKAEGKLIFKTLNEQASSVITLVKRSNTKKKHIKKVQMEDALHIPYCNCNKSLL